MIGLLAAAAEPKTSNYLEVANRVGFISLTISIAVLLIAVGCFVFWNRAPGRFAQRHPLFFLTSIALALMFLADPLFIHAGSLLIGHKVTDSDRLHVGYHTTIGIIVLLALWWTYRRHFQRKPMR